MLIHFGQMTEGGVTVSPGGNEMEDDRKLHNINVQS